jgi:hypothetical protein
MISIAIVSDSLLSYASFSKTRFLKPERQNNTPICVNVAKRFENDRLQIRQFAYSGLKAFMDHGNGKKDRKIFFQQLRIAYSGE